MTSTLTTERIRRTQILLMNRPESRNALTRGLLAELSQGLRAAATDDAVRCVVLGGAGGHFCAGADLRKTFADDPNLLDHLDEYLDAFHEVIHAIVECPKPVIAMLDGCAVGFGADMALACDFRVASTTSYLQEKFVKIGLMPDGGGTFWLPRLLGTARAMTAIFLADKLDASTMDRYGLLAAAPASPDALSDTLRSATLRLAYELEQGPPLAFARAKRAVHASLGDFKAALQREREGQLELLRSADAMEGIMAWSQKREPDFKGA